MAERCHREKKQEEEKEWQKKKTPIVHHELDGWLDSVDSLKKDLAKLKAVFDKNKKAVTKGDVTKPEEPKAKPELTKKPPFGKPEEEPEDKDQGGQEDDPQVSTPTFKKKPNPLVKKDTESEPEEE